jgi:rhodanese-related sulfurtransferase
LGSIEYRTRTGAVATVVRASLLQMQQLKIRKRTNPVASATWRAYCLWKPGFRCGTPNFVFQPGEFFMKLLQILFAATFLCTAASASAQQAAPNAPTAPRQWTAKTPKIDRAAVDKYLADPGKVLILDVRRPDELIKNGSFPAFLNIQVKELENNLAYIPKDRAIIVVSNHAWRGGSVGDKLSEKGFKVVGATGSLDYEEQGGTVARITPPPPREGQPAAAAAAAAK